MVIELSKEQQGALEANAGKPIHVVHPQTQKVYVLVDGEIYNRFRSLFEGDSFDVRETYAAQSAAAGATGWDDPEMDVYDDCDPNKPH